MPKNIAPEITPESGLLQPRLVLRRKLLCGISHRWRKRKEEDPTPGFYAEVCIRCGMERRGANHPVYGYWPSKPYWPRIRRVYNSMEYPMLPPAATLREVAAWIKEVAILEELNGSWEVARRMNDLAADILQNSQDQESPPR